MHAMDTRTPLASQDKPVRLDAAARRTLRMGLVSWQRNLMGAPGLLATPDGLAEWERIGELLEALK